MKISKFNNLKLAEVFFQLNFIDGFKYIDKAGEIMNRYVKKYDKIPQFQMNPSGLLVQNPTPDIGEIRVTPTSLWMHFKTVPNIGFVEQKICEEVEAIMGIVEVSNAQRAGLRTYLIKDSADIDKNLAIAPPTKKFKLLSLVSMGELNDTSLRVEVNPVEKDNNSSGILFDVDMFINGEVEISSLSSTLSDFRTNLQSNDFIKLINEHLK